MILFFYGEDNYRLNQKIKALKAKFISASLGDTNLSILDGKSVTYDEIVRQILAMPFLSRTRLVIIENLLTAKRSDIQEKVAEFLKKIPSSTVLVFAEGGKPDKRTVLYKRLNQPGQAQEYKLLEEEQLKRWIKKEVDARGATIESDATSLLVEYIGPDLWRMANEIEKLIAYRLPTTANRGGKTIIAQDIKLLVLPEIKSNIFNLIDAIASKNLPKAYQELYRLLNSGENEIYILTMIVYQFRNLLIVKDLIERSPNIDRWQIAKKAGMHPFVAEKTLYQVKNFTLEKLKSIYRNLLDFDYKIKTGKIEQRVALELLIFQLSQRRQSDKVGNF